ncbi:MAG: hypothetical protein E6Q33_02400 [Neisseriales bacterium]|nr:MAG: hypothetical protein E6Q33_02400 [Neisseriales bacterium]
MKFDISVTNNTGGFIKVGFVKPTKSGKALQLTIYADKVDLLQKSQCGKFCNALMVEDKRPDKHQG